MNSLLSKLKLKQQRIHVPTPNQIENKEFLWFLEEDLVGNNEQSLVKLLKEISSANCKSLDVYLNRSSNIWQSLTNSIIGQDIYAYLHPGIPF